MLWNKVCLAGCYIGLVVQTTWIELQIHQGIVIADGCRSPSTPSLFPHISWLPLHCVLLNKGKHPLKITWGRMYKQTNHDSLQSLHCFTFCWHWLYFLIMCVIVIIIAESIFFLPLNTFFTSDLIKIQYAERYWSSDTSLCRKVSLYIYGTLHITTNWNGHTALLHEIRK